MAPDGDSYNWRRKKRFRSLFFLNPNFCSYFGICPTNKIDKLEAVDYQRVGRIVAGRCSDEGRGLPVELSRLFSTGRGSLVSAGQRADGVRDRHRGLDGFLAFEQGMDVAS